MDISEDLSPDDNMMVYRMTPTSILSSESAAARSTGSVSGGTAELGRRLLLAARHGDTQLVLDLMAKGAPFTTDWLGTSALHLAAVGAHAGTCAVLLRAGVSRDARTKVERTPLHVAAHAGHAAVAALLLQHRARPDTRDMLHMTPLHWAAARGHGEVVALLLRHGADPAAVSKFNKTPRALAAAARPHPHPHVLKLIDDALRAREAAQSVESLQLANNEPESTDPQPSVGPAERLQEAAKQTIKQSQTQFQSEPIKISIEKPSESSPGAASGSSGGSAGSGGAAGAAGAAGGAGAAVLRRHGIALLPRDEGSTVLSALQSGRSVVLSDAGKLMLKESSEVPQVVVKGSPTPTGPGPTKGIVLTNPPGSGPSKRVVLTNPPGSGPSKGVVLTATPVKSTPRQGVKIFTLNNKLLAMPKENKAPVKKVINPHDSMQVQYIKLSSDTKISSRVISMKAKNKDKIPGGGARPLKLTLHNANFNKLLINENDVQMRSPPAGGSSTERNVLVLPEEFLTNSSAKYLRTQLLSAHRTIAQLNAQLNNYKTRLANYENV